MIAIDQYLPELTGEPSDFPSFDGHVLRAADELVETLRQFGADEPIRVPNALSPSVEPTLDTLYTMLGSWSEHVRGRSSVIYLAGHGYASIVNNVPSHYLLLPSANRRFDPTDAAFPTSLLANYLVRRDRALRESASGDRSGEWTIVILDCCDAGVARSTIEVAGLPDGHMGVWLIPSVASGQAFTGNFVATLCSVLRQTFSGVNDHSVPLSDVQEQLIEELSDPRPNVDHVLLSHLRAQLDLAIPGFSASDAQVRTASTSVLRRLRSEDEIVSGDWETVQAILQDLPSDFRDHLLPKARGCDINEFAWHFQGREEELAAICDFARGASPGVLLVTGPPGGGKSALIGQFVMLANPRLRNSLIAAGNLAAPTLLPPDDVVDLGLHLVGLGVQQVVDRLGHFAGSRSLGSEQGSLDHKAYWPSDADRLRPGQGQGAFKSRASVGDALDSVLALLQRYNGMLTIVIDGLDEAAEPIPIAQTVLRRLAGLTNVRLIIGTRRGVTERLDTPFRGDEDLIQALGPIYRRLDIEGDPVAVENYVTRRLEAGPPRIPPASVARIASEIASAGQPFLFARLATTELAFIAAAAQGDDNTAAGITPEDPRVAALLAADFRGVFEFALARFSPSTRMLLKGLAYSLGRGVPRRGGTWRALAVAASDEDAGPRLDQTAIDLLLKEAAPYITVDGEFGQDAFRLAHRLFVEHFLSNDSAVHAKFVALVVKDVNERPTSAVSPWARVNAYVARYLPDHARLGDQLELVMSRDDCVDNIDQDALASAILGTHFGRGELPTKAEAAIRIRSLEVSTAVRRGLARSSVAAFRNRQVFDRRSLNDDSWRPVATMGMLPAINIVLASCETSMQTLAATSPSDGSALLAAGGSDGSIRIWDLDNASQVGDAFSGHDGATTSLAFGTLANGQTILVSAGTDGSVRLWDPVSGRERGRPLVRNSRPIVSVSLCLLPDGRTLLAAGGADGVIELWDVAVSESIGRLRPRPEHGRILERVEGNGLAIRSVHVETAAAGLQWLVAVLNDGTVRQWDLGPILHRRMRVSRTRVRSWKMSLSGASNPTCPIAFGSLNDGKRLIALINSRRELELRSELFGSSPTTFRVTNGGDVTTMALGRISRERSAIAIGRSDGLVQVMYGEGAGLPTPRSMNLIGHTSEVTAIVLPRLSDGRTLLVSASADGSVRVWDPSRPSQRVKPPGRSWRPDGSGAAVGFEDRVPRPIASLAMDQCSNGAPLLVTGSSSGIVQMWDPLALTPVGSPLIGHKDRVDSVGVRTLSSGRTLVATASADRTVRLWDPGTSEPIGLPLTGFSGFLVSVAFSPPTIMGDLLVTWSADDPIQVWDISRNLKPSIRRQWGASTKVGLPLAEFMGSLYDVAIGIFPGGRTVIAAGGSLGLLYLWDLETGRPIGDPLAHSSPITAIAFSQLADGQGVVVTGSMDGSVVLWNATNETPSGRLVVGHTGVVTAVTSVNLSDGHSVIVTASRDETIRIWDPTSAAQIGLPLCVHFAPVRFLASGSAPGKPGLLASASTETLLVLEEGVEETTY